MSYDRVDAAESGALPNNRTNWIETSIVGPAAVSFWWRTSSQTNSDRIRFFINGLQWTGYKKMSFTSVGESACADSWGKALRTGEPALTIPCYAERRYGGVPDDEMLMATPPEFVPKMIAGLEALSRNGLRYPIPLYGIQNDARAGLGYSYGS